MANGVIAHSIDAGHKAIGYIKTRSESESCKVHRKSARLVD